MKPVPIEAQMDAFYELEVIKVLEDGTRVLKRKLGPFHNLLTDLGLNVMGDTNSYLGTCYVGTGNAAPTFLDTQLQAKVASAGWVSVTNTFQPSPPYYTTSSFLYEFATGAAAGNLTEIGVGIAAAQNYLFSHALIQDSGDNPTSLVIESDEILRVTYSVRLYPPSADLTGTINISGVDYNYVLRPSIVNTGIGAYSSGWSLAYGTPTGAGFPGIRSEGNAYDNAAYSGPIGAATAKPSGTSAAASQSSPSYVSQSFESKTTLSWGINSGNLAGGIQSVFFGFFWCAYQIQFTPPIPKDSNTTLSLTFKHSWARKIL